MTIAKTNICPKALALALLQCLIAPYAEASVSTKADTALKQIATVVVIYAENRSFDNLYGLFPGADGVLYNADGSHTDLKRFQQVDRDGETPLQKLPPVWNAHDSKLADPLQFISALPNAPFRIDAPPGGLPGGLAPREPTPDLVHRFYENQMQINGGKNDSFAAWSNAGGLTMGYYDGSTMQMWALAKQYTLADHFFMGAFGGSFLNHFWLVCACTPVFANAPSELYSQVEGKSNTLRIADTSPASALNGAPLYSADKPLTPDGYAVNTTQPPYQPSKIKPASSGDERLADPTQQPLPPQTFKTIGDTLSQKNISWAWYAGAWQEALKSRSVIYQEAGANFQPHHQPFNYFTRFDPSTAKGAAERDLHLKDYTDLQNDITQGTLPAVTFYKPQGNLNQHPGYTDVLSGDAHIAGLIENLQNSLQWSQMAIIVTYDENGGYWDHVTPPKGDRWGPGSRIPTIIISPFAKNHYVDHTPYDTTSIIKFITRRFGLEPLPGVRPKAGDLSNAFKLTK